MEIFEIYNTHQKAAPPREVIHKTEQCIPWSDVIATQIIEQHVENGALFEVYQTSGEALDAFATMEMPRYEIEEHMDSLMRFVNTCIFDFVPIPPPPPSTPQPTPSSSSSVLVFDQAFDFNK